MTTTAAIQALIESRHTSELPAVTFTYQNETHILPNTPATFVHVELIAEGMEIVAFGGGRGANLQRTTGRIEAHVMTPVGEGIDGGLALAEQIAAVWRSYRDADISCFAAEAFPGEGRVEDGNYANSAVAIVDVHWDRTG